MTKARTPLPWAKRSVGFPYRADKSKVLPFSLAFPAIIGGVACFGL